jgi:CubicO group peptidase (beta-lactamase class C family)
MNCSRLRLAALTLLLTTGALSARASAQEMPLAWTPMLDSLVLAELERTRTPGAQVAVAFNGRVILSRGYGVADIETGRAVSPQTLFRVGSVTKMVTGAIIAQLASEGKLDLQSSISRYLPELTGRLVGRVTTHQLLTHTAGWIDNAVPFGRMGEGALGEVMREIADTLFFTEAGRVISYSNPGYSMAGYVAERATGRRYGDLADEMILRPMGMPHATFRPLHALTHDFSQGHVGQPQNAGTVVRPFTENTAQWAAGFLLASAQDMARFSITLMNAGLLDGELRLRPDAVRLMTQGSVAIPGSTARYGYGLQVSDGNPELVWQHGGSINGFDASVVMLPNRGLAVVVLDNRSGAPLRGIVDLVVQQLTGQSPRIPPEPPAPRVATAAERSQIAGTYAQSRNVVTIADEGDSLVFRAPGTTASVRLVGDDRIVVTPAQGAPATIILVRGADGRVEYLHQGLRARARQP